MPRVERGCCAGRFAGGEADGEQQEGFVHTVPDGVRSSHWHQTRRVLVHAKSLSLTRFAFA